jgi:hypothetical protein
MTDDAPKIDPLTVAAIAIVAYCASNVIHEGLGHGGACVLLHGKPEALNAIFFQCDPDSLSENASRLVSAGGSLANGFFAGLTTGALGSWKRNDSFRYFLWLFLAVNLLTPFGYLLFSGIGGLGDWADVIVGVRFHLAWRVVEVIGGALLYFVAAPLTLWPIFAGFLGAGDKPDRLRRARLLSLVPYFVGAATFLIAGMRNPYGVELVLISAAAASLGGTSLLAWFFVVRARQTDGSGSPVSIPRSIPWILAGAITLLVFVNVLGPGIALH